MSQFNGKMVTCDRCKKQIFLKTTGEGETDGGFTRWNKFEEPPAGWSLSRTTRDLCPDCYEKYKELQEEMRKREYDFMNMEA